MKGIHGVGSGHSRRDRPVSRRQFARRLVSIGAAAVGSRGSGGVLFGQASPAGPDTAPLVIGFDLSLVDDWLTPNELFFVREHFPAPRLSQRDWTVSVSGAVERPLKLNYNQILNRPRVDLPAVLECAGNPVGGGMIGNAEWNGVRLGALLDEAGPLPESGFVRLVGGDGEPGGVLKYSRSIPLAKALHPETLLAYGMNGEPLPRHHGFPVRAIVPGWYGMDSVKWLTAIEILTEPDNSPLMTRQYLREVLQPNGDVAAQPVTQVAVKSAFSRPLDGAVLFRPRVPVRGIAWAGENRVSTVEVSTDRGVHWENASLTGEGPSAPRPYSWVQWRYDWNIPGPGAYELAVRATDDRGNTQPSQRPSNRQDLHELNHYERVRCTVA